MANLATVTIKFKSEGASTVKKDTNDLLNTLKGLAAQFGIVTTVAGAFTAAVAGLAYGTYKLSQASLAQYRELETLIRALAVYQNSVSSAASQLQRLRTIALQPGLSLEQVAKGVLYLEAAGFSASISERAIKAFGNALALAGKGADDLAGVQLALGQIKSKGVISAEEINQIAERVPQVRKAIQDAFGTSNTKELQKMGINATVFITKVIKELEKLKKAPQTIESFIKNITDTFKYSGAIIGRGISDMLSGQNTKIGTDLLFTIKSLAIEFSKMLSGIASSPYFQQIAGNLRNFLNVLKEAAPFIAQNFAIVLSGFLAISNAALKVITNIMNLLNKMFEDLYNVLNGRTDIRPFDNLRKELERLVSYAQITKLAFKAVFADIVYYIDLALSKIPGLKLKQPLELTKREAVAANNYYNAAAEQLMQQGPTAGEKAIFGSLGALNPFSIMRDAMAMSADAMRMVQGKFGGITPFGLDPGKQGPTEDAKAKDEEDKKKQLKALQVIGENTKKQNELTLRNLTYGGGELAAQGLSAVERSGLRSVSSPQISASNDIVRGVEKIVRAYSNSNNLNFSFRRS
jgi:tape measure domain-containing protein